MKIKKSSFHLLTAFLMLHSAQVGACGSGFSWSLLQDRPQVLKTFPERYFRDDVRSLIKINPTLPRIEQRQENAYLQDEKWFEKGLDVYDPLFSLKRINQIEQKYLGKKTAETIMAVRQLDDIEAVHSYVQDLKPSIESYVLAAHAFHQQDYVTAKEYFKRVIELDDQTNPLYAVWARYSLARTLAILGEDQEALAYFAGLSGFIQSQTKFQDDLNLVLSSMGEQARLYLNQGNYNRAIALYAQQNAQGDSSGEGSLVIVAKKLMRLPFAELQVQLQQPFVQRLMISWLLATTNQHDVLYVYDNDSTQEKELQKVKNIVSYMVHQTNIVEDQKTVFAQMLYQQGRFDLSAALLPELADSGTKWWITAKIASREGRIEDARAAYAKAASFFPQQSSAVVDPWSAVPNEFCRVSAESAVVALKQNDFEDAMWQLWQGREFYWEDVAYIAERVLTTTQLITFVDQHAKKVDSKRLKDRNQDGRVDEEDQYYPLPVEQRLRNVLARRLMREQQYDQALKYFDPEIKRHAQDFINAHSKLEAQWKTDLKKAVAAFEAGWMIREYGMQLLGYEGYPDDASSDGNFQGINDQELLKHNRTWMSDQEYQRLAQTQAQPNLRYHYRTIAAQFAQRAADYLPERSQAYAATLCYASRWTINSDPKTSLMSYQRYLNHGAFVSWGNQFGQQCPQPEFQSLWYKQWYYPWLEIKQTLRPYKVMIYWGVFMLMISALMITYRLKFKK